MPLCSGQFYFISDAFFQFASDPFLKLDYTSTKRPHYFSYQDPTTGLHWMIPVSSKVEKFKKLIEDKKKLNKPADGIKIIKIFDNEAILLLQDMFPITENFIEEPYLKGNTLVSISDPKKIVEIEKCAKKVVKLLHHGIKFTPTQPNVLELERKLLNSIQNDR